MTQTSGTPAENSRTLAIGAFAVGLVALLVLIVLFGTMGGMTPLVIATILGIVAIVLGVLGVRRGTARGFAIAGIVTGSLAIVFSLGILFFALLFIGALGI